MHFFRNAALSGLILAACSGDKPGDSAPTTPATGPSPTAGTGTGTGTTGTGTGTGGTPGTCSTGVVEAAWIGCTTSTAFEGLGLPYETLSETTYDACGRAVRSTTFDLFAGTPSSESLNTYDPTHGELIRVDIDQAPLDGVPEETWTYVYDAQVRLEAIERALAGATGPYCVDDYIHLDADAFEDEMLNGCSDPVQRLVHTRQPDGDVIVTTIDVDDDGTVDQTTTYTYDANDRLETSTTVSGYGTTLTTWVWDGDRIAQLITDEDGDGSPEATSTYTYDAAGRTTRIDIDSVDGQFALVYTWTCP